MEERRENPFFFVVVVFECNFTIFTLFPLHGLNISSTAASHSLLISHSMTDEKQAIFASLCFEKYVIIVLFVEYNLTREDVSLFRRRLWRFGDARIILFVALISGYVE